MSAAKGLFQRAKAPKTKKRKRGNGMEIRRRKGRGLEGERRSTDSGLGLHPLPKVGEGKKTLKGDR